MQALDWIELNWNDMKWNETEFELDRLQYIESNRSKSNGIELTCIAYIELHEWLAGWMAQFLLISDASITPEE